MYVCMYVYLFLIGVVPLPDKEGGNLTEADGAGRKLKFVVYEPIKAAYFEGFIRSRYANTHTYIHTYMHTYIHIF